MKNDMKIEEIVKILEKNSEMLKDEETDIDTGIKIFEESVKLFALADAKLKDVKQRVYIYNTQNGETEEFEDAQR